LNKKQTRANITLSTHHTNKKLAQLSQRGRAMFPVIKYFAKSLNVYRPPTRDHTKPTPLSKACVCPY